MVVVILALQVIAVALTSYFFPVVGILVGLAGVAAYLTGTVRKGLAEAQKEVIATQDHQIVELKAEVAALRGAKEQNAAAIAVLVQQVKGVTELTALTREVAELGTTLTERTKRFNEIDHQLELIRRAIARLDKKVTG